MYRRSLCGRLASRLDEPRRFIQAVVGPRQTGKTTLVRQMLEGRPHVFASADAPTLEDRLWLERQWELGRLRAREEGGAVLALDEIQKVQDWSESVKRLWDEDTAAGLTLHVVLLGSAPLLVQRGLGESLAGRFEAIHVPHWSLAEMRDAFDFGLDDYLVFGAYPGAAPLTGEPERWRAYVRDSLVETTVGRDVLLMTRVHKPALLRRLFQLGCEYSGQILSYTKMLGQLQDAGNTTTLAHYMDLLAGAGMLAGLPRYPGAAARRRGSSPKLNVLNTALMTAVTGRDMASLQADPDARGRLVESAVGAHLLNGTVGTDAEVLYWRDRNQEVDFVLRRGVDLVAVEVKSGARARALPGLAAFVDAHPRARTLSVGGDGLPLEEFLLRPVADWFGR